MKRPSRRWACVLACLWALPLAAQQPAGEAVKTPARQPDAELPLPAAPIPVPTLSAQAGKPELLEAYYQLTGGRMFEVLIAQAVQPPASLKARVADCPPAKQAMEAQYRDVVAPHFRGWIDNTIRPRILAVLDEAFGEAELRAFLRFAATPNGQRHLHQIATQEGSGDVSHFPEFLTDPDLRAYDRQFDALGDQVSGVFASTQSELLTPAYMADTRRAGARIADLVQACQAAAKP